MAKLYLGNLPWKTRESDLEEFLTGRGVTSFTKADVVHDRETGRSRGFGFAHFETEAEASDALEKLSDAVLGGRSLVVDRATERQRDRDERRSAVRSAPSPREEARGRRGRRREEGDGRDAW